NATAGASGSNPRTRKVPLSFSPLSLVWTMEAPVMINAKPYRILLIDDNPVARETCRYLLTAGDSAGHLRRLQDGTGADGLRRCRSDQRDCVLLDYVLPDVDGLEFITRLSNEQSEMAAPVVMLTGFADYAVAVRAMKGGAADYLAKDKVTEHGLRRAITNAI